MPSVSNKHYCTRFWPKPNDTMRLSSDKFRPLCSRKSLKKACADCKARWLVMPESMMSWLRKKPSTSCVSRKVSTPSVRNA